MKKVQFDDCNNHLLEDEPIDVEAIYANEEQLSLNDLSQNVKTVAEQTKFWSIKNKNKILKNILYIFYASWLLFISPTAHYRMGGTFFISVILFSFVTIILFVLTIVKTVNALKYLIIYICMSPVLLLVGIITSSDLYFYLFYKNIHEKYEESQIQYIQAVSNANEVPLLDINRITDGAKYYSSRDAVNRYNNQVVDIEITHLSNFDDPRIVNWMDSIGYGPKRYNNCLQIYSKLFWLERPDFNVTWMIFYSKIRSDEFADLIKGGRFQRQVIIRGVFQLEKDKIILNGSRIIRTGEIIPVKRD